MRGQKKAIENENTEMRDLLNEQASFANQIGDNIPIEASEVSVSPETEAFIEESLGFADPAPSTDETVDNQKDPVAEESVKNTETAAAGYNTVAPSLMAVKRFSCTPIGGVVPHNPDPSKPDNDFAGMVVKHGLMNVCYIPREKPLTCLEFWGKSKEECSEEELAKLEEARTMSFRLTASVFNLIHKPNGKEKNWFEFKPGWTRAKAIHKVMDDFRNAAMTFIMLVKKGDVSVTDAIKELSISFNRTFTEVISEFNRQGFYLSTDII